MKCLHRCCRSISDYDTRCTWLMRLWNVESMRQNECQCHLRCFDGWYELLPNREMNWCRDMPKFGLFEFFSVVQLIFSHRPQLACDQWVSIYNRKIIYDWFNGYRQMEILRSSIFIYGMNFRIANYDDFYVTFNKKLTECLWPPVAAALVLTIIIVLIDNF